MTEKNQILHFFIGKGGVGKSTLSALAAVSAARPDRPVRLVSLDPAHNQGDIFMCRLSRSPRKVHPGLEVIEIDCEQWMRKYLKETRRHLETAYRYQEAFNLHGYFDILRHAPGLEEYALQLAFSHALNTRKGSGLFFFDLPPTALSLKFFALPFLTLHWLQALLKMRSEICAAREIISKIRIGKVEVEGDKVKARLEGMIESHRQLCERFQSPRTHIHLVLNPEPLSLAEAARIRSKLEGIGLAVDRVLVNKAAPGPGLDAIRRTFSDRPLICYPPASRPLFGIAALRDYLKSCCAVFPEDSMEKASAANCAQAGPNPSQAEDFR